MLTWALTSAALRLTSLRRWLGAAAASGAARGAMAPALEADDDDARVTEACFDIFDVGRSMGIGLEEGEQRGERGGDGGMQEGDREKDEAAAAAAVGVEIPPSTSPSSSPSF